jgi:hypothetical protein
MGILYPVSTTPTIVAPLGYQTKIRSHKSSRRIREKQVASLDELQIDCAIVDHRLFRNKVKIILLSIDK